MYNELFMQPEYPHRSYLFGCRTAQEKPSSHDYYASPLMMSSAQKLRSAMSFIHGNILVLSITNLLANFSRALVFRYASLYILALNGDATKLGLINALVPLIGLFLFPIAGYIADYVGQVKIIALSNYLSTAVILLFVLAPNWQWIAVAMLLRGVVTLQFPARSAMIVDSLSPEERGKGWGTMNTIASVLSIFAPWSAGTIVQIS